MKKFIFTLSVLLSFSTASSEEAEKGKERIGPGKAVVAANEKEGFKLSDKAQKSLGLTIVPVTSNRVTLPVSALVSFQDFQAVYRHRDGWFRLVEIEPQINGEQATFTINDLKADDKLVTGNSGLLRVVELDVFGPEADACAD